MDNRNATLIIVAIVGIVVGVGVVNMTAKPQVQDNNSMLGQQLGMIISSQSATNEKLAKLEEQQKAIMNIFQETKQMAMRMQQQPQQFPQPQPGQQAPQQMPPQEDMNMVYSIPIDQSPVRGNKNAKVTLTEFVDFQCPFCSRFHTVSQDALKAYPNDVKYVIKNYPLPFHPNAKPGAKAALAAGEQGKYWEMADTLLSNNQDLSEDRFKTEAKNLGLDVDRFMKDYKDKDAQWEATLNKDMSLAAQVDVRGTPTFYLNGKKTMARDAASLKVEIDKILKGN